MSVTVERVLDARGLREFVELPLRLQPRELGVPLLEASIRSWFTGRSPHPEPVDLLLARDADGTVVGRSTAHTDRRLDAKLGEPLQLFGATEFRDGEAAAALFAELDRRARVRGAAALFGPVTLLPNQAGGIITSAFGERGFVDSAWNDELAPIVYESEGFERWGEADTWVVDIDPAGERQTTAPAADEWEAAGLVLERGSKREMKRLVPELLALLNASFAQLPYYTQITADEMDAATDGLAFLLDEQLLLLARDRASGTAVSFVLVLPDITRFLQRIGGRLTPIRQVQLLLTRGRYREEAVLVIQGTHPSRQGQGILTLLSRQLQANLAAGGYRRLRSTYVGRDNPGSTVQFERFGGRPLHAYTFYRRPVVGSGPPGKAAAAVAAPAPDARAPAAPGAVAVRPAAAPGHEAAPDHGAARPAAAGSEAAPGAAAPGGPPTPEGDPS